MKEPCVFAKNFYIFCLNVGKLFVVLQSQTAAQRPRSGMKCGGSAKSFGNLTVSEASVHTYMNSVYPRWFLTIRNSRKISYLCQGLGNGRCLRWCNVRVRNHVREDMSGCIGCIYWRRASALPSDIDRAMREASDSRTVTDTDSYAILFILT